MKIAIIAAMPAELRRLVKPPFERRETTQRNSRKWALKRGQDQWIAVCAGMGGDAATRALAEAEADGAVDAVLSVGFAGALVERFSPGTVAVASAVVDARTGERFQPGGGGVQDRVLVSTARVADAAEKRRLAETYGAAMVDMESATLARLAEARRVPLCCVKAITDGPDLLLPDFSPFLDSDGSLRYWLFIAHVLLRPGYWRSLVTLGRMSARGAENLASAVLTLLTGDLDFSRTNRTGTIE